MREAKHCGIHMFSISSSLFRQNMPTEVIIKCTLSRVDITNKSAVAQEVEQVDLSLEGC